MAPGRKVPPIERKLAGTLFPTFHRHQSTCFYMHFKQTILHLFVFYECIEAPVNEYDKKMAQNMMRNNQVLQRLGITALASIVNNTFPKSKGSGPEDSGSLYDPQENEDSEQQEVDKVLILLCMCKFVLSLLQR